MNDQLIRLGLGILFIGTLFGILQWLFPAQRGQRFFRAGMLTDLGYFALAPLVTRNVTRIGVALALVPFAYYSGIAIQDLTKGHGAVGAQAYWAQAIQIIVLTDFMRYWVHRLFHGGWLWKVHAVHHSSQQMDWLASVRVHPLNDLVPAVLTVPPLVIAGYAPAAVAAVLPFLTLFAIGLHANLNWDFGPFRYVIASPAFHRWHHTMEDEGRDKNFAGLFPIWDLMFGTFYMPRGETPERFGVSDPVPGNIFGQLIYPFVPSRRRDTVE